MIAIELLLFSNYCTLLVCCYVWYVQYYGMLIVLCEHHGLCPTYPLSPGIGDREEVTSMRGEEVTSVRGEVFDSLVLDYHSEVNKDVSNRISYSSPGIHLSVVVQHTCKSYLPPQYGGLQDQ